MTSTALSRVRLALLALGLAVRVPYLSETSALHPDEFFQYLEPAFNRLTGAGTTAWEYRDGLRSWVLPGFNGSLLALALSFGVPGHLLGKVLQAVWCALSLTLIPVSFRAGMAITRKLIRSPEFSRDSTVGWEGGLLAALLCATFPWLVNLSVHTLCELPAILLLTAALTLCVDLTDRPPGEALRAATWIGALLAFGVLLRISYAPCAALPIAMLSFSRRPALLWRFALGALGPTLLFGVVDWMTWGIPFVSFIRYMTFNVSSGHAGSVFGVEPAYYYAQTLASRLPYAMLVVAALCVHGFRASWILSLTAVGVVAVLSAQPHKEERFVVLFWPLILISVAGSAGALLVQARRAGRQQLGYAALVSLTAFICIDAYAHGALELNYRATADRMKAQSWLAKRDDVSGILSTDVVFSGGQTWLGSALPQVPFDVALLSNAVFSHVVVNAGTLDELQAHRAGFERCHNEGLLVVLARKSRSEIRR